MTGTGDLGGAGSLPRTRDSRPLTVVAIGLAITLFDVTVGIPVLPDPLGWTVAAVGVAQLRSRHRDAHAALGAQPLGLRTPALLGAALWLAVVLTPLSFVDYVGSDSPVVGALTVAAVLLDGAFVVALMAVVRSLTPRESTRRVATLVMGIYAVVTTLSVLAQLLLPETERQLQADTATVALFVVAAIAYVGLTVTFLVWLHRVGRQEPFLA